MQKYDSLQVRIFHLECYLICIFTLRDLLCQLKEKLSFQHIFQRQRYFSREPMASSLFQVLARRLAENDMKDLQKDLRYRPETLPILIPKNNDTPRSTQRGDTSFALNSRPQGWRTAHTRRIPLGRMASSNSNYKSSSHYAANRTLPKKRLPRKTIWASDYI